MSDAPNNTRDWLIQRLFGPPGVDKAGDPIGFPSDDECDVVLRAGGFPINDTTRQIFKMNSLWIKREYERRTRIREPQLANAFRRFAWGSAGLLEESQGDTDRQALEIMNTALIFGYELTEQVLKELRDTAAEHVRIAEMLRTDFENWFFEECYSLYARLKGRRPGNAAPLYRFTEKCTKLVGMKFNIGEDAFRMRIGRLLSRRREEIKIPDNVQ